MLNPFTAQIERLRTIEEVERSRAVSTARTVNRIYYLTRSNKWDWFVTLTFDPEKVDSFNYEECTKKLSVWLMHCKRKCPDMKYIVVPELHKSGRYHFHGLFADCDELKFIDSSKRIGENIIYNIGSYKLGFTTATRVQDTKKVAKYVTKYITKDLCQNTFNKRRYWSSRNLNEAEVEEMFLDTADKGEFLQSLNEYITYTKTVETPYCETKYYELNTDISVIYEKGDI